MYLLLHFFFENILSCSFFSLLSLQFIQPPGSAPTEVMEFSLPQHSISWIQALAHYLRQNLLIFLHIPKYTDSNMEHHFKVTFTLCVPFAASRGLLHSHTGFNALWTCSLFKWLTLPWLHGEFRKINR